MNAPAIAPRQYLSDICFIRIILIFLLIIYHSLCPYTSDYWENPQSVDIPVYYWTGRLCYSFMLESFVFISGLILGHQVLKRGSAALSLGNLIGRKIKRLILPSMIFSIIYYLIFIDSAESPASIAATIVNGTGHLWFLPMLFWCFVGMYLISKLKWKTKTIILLLAVTATVSVITLPLRLNLSMYYLLFFYLGFATGNNLINLKPYMTTRALIVTTMTFLILFFIFSNLRYGTGVERALESIGGDIPLRIRLLFLYSFQRLCQLIYSTAGVLMLYIAVNRMIATGAVSFNHRIMTLSSYCFGVYIFQEFIIRIFYYKLHFIEKLNPYTFPLYSIAVTLLLSILLTHLSMKTKTGRFLLG